MLPPRRVTPASPPEVLFLDLPLLTGDEPPFAPRVAAFARPWPGAVAIALGTAEAGFLPRQAMEQAAVMGELTEPLGPGPLWRYDRANRITVRLYGGSLASLPELAVLNGGNVAAVGDPETGFEVIQFRTATMLDATTWQLEGLLRGQGGTGDVAAAGHAPGARFVLLNAAVAPLAVSEAEAWLSLTARCGPADTVYDPDLFVDVPLSPARRGLTCLAPVRLRAVRDVGSGDIAISWIRQTRTGGDAWEPVEVPSARRGKRTGSTSSTESRWCGACDGSRAVALLYGGGADRGLRVAARRDRRAGAAGERDRRTRDSGGASVRVLRVLLTRCLARDNSIQASANLSPAHSRARGNPVFHGIRRRGESWIPACAGHERMGPSRREHPNAARPPFFSNCIE